MRILAIGCAAIALIFLLLTGGFIAWLIIEKPVLDASISMPPIVTLDTTFTMTVTTSNAHEKAIILDSIDIADTYLDGFQVVEITPEPESTMSILNMRTWDFSMKVQPGDALAVHFVLRAVKQGHYSGDVDICNPNQDYFTLIADTVVRKDSVEQSH